MRLVFWGVRGSFPVPGEDTLVYGGNTSCLELELAGAPRVILDAGSGLRLLGRRLIDNRVGDLVLLLTHLHWDHVMGFPFFEPAYRAGVRIRLGGFERALQGLERMFDSGGCDGCFPVQFSQLAARIDLDPELCQPSFPLGEARVNLLPLNHPQGSVGLRVEENGKSLVFITDHELTGHGRPGLEETARFAEDADILVHDAQYVPEELLHRRGWGHSDWRSVVELARRAGVGRLVLTHHDPGRTDTEVAELARLAQEAAGPGLLVEAAWEGLALEL
ncbi:MAG: MBL fold metallo-hydrolase [Deltaproteobacteria bacterium]|nr:MBL fold metallo-hydrolase [Deltaproteobacteria bacterium]